MMACLVGRKARSALFVLLFGAAVSAAQEVSLGSTIRAIVAEPAVARAHWGVAVVRLDGTAVAGLNEGQFFRPASTAKLFITSAALAMLGEAHTVETDVTAALPASGEAGQTGVAGSLTLHGAGDDNLARRVIPYQPPARLGTKAGPGPANPVNPLEAMADQVAAAGVTRVEGPIVGDDSLWPAGRDERLGAEWSQGDLLWGYGAPVTALGTEDNAVALRVMPGAAPGSPATVSLDPLSDAWTLDAQVSTVAAKQPAALAISREPGSAVLRVRGTVAVGAPEIEELAVDEPALFAARLFRAMLLRRGIAVDGPAESAHRAQGAGPPAGVACTEAARCRVLARHTSPTLAEDVAVTLKTSQNQHAETILRLLGQAAGRDGSVAEGTRAVREFAALTAGVDPGDLVLQDGSGLSTQDLVTPRAMARLLVFAAGQSWGTTLRSALPVGGVDGTLATRFPDAALRGRVEAKTGTLGESRALAGYVTGKSGSIVAFAIFADDHAPGLAGAPDRAAMDGIVAAIAAAE